MPRNWRSQPASMIHSAAGDSAGDADQQGAGDVAGQRQACASAAQARPPSTSAPSPPMIRGPRAPGMATHRAVSISGAARCSVFCHENQSPNAPLNSSSQTSSRVDAGERDEDAEQQQRGHDGGDRQQDA